MILLRNSALTPSVFGAFSGETQFWSPGLDAAPRWSTWIFLWKERTGTLITNFSLAWYHDGPDEIDTNDTVACRDHNLVSGYFSCPKRKYILVTCFSNWCSTIKLRFHSIWSGLYSDHAVSSWSKFAFCSTTWLTILTIDNWQTGSLLLACCSPHKIVYSNCVVYFLFQRTLRHLLQQDIRKGEGRTKSFSVLPSPVLSNTDVNDRSSTTHKGRVNLYCIVLSEPNQKNEPEPTKPNRCCFYNEKT